jgi:hypothetical protein
MCGNFGIKYVGREHSEHLAFILHEHYKCKLEWEGQQYLGMHINWVYTGRAVHISMLDYVPEALTQFQHPPPRILQHQLYPHVKPNYGTKAQFTEDVDTSSLLDKKAKIHPRGHWHFSVLRLLCQQHHVTRTWLSCNATIQPNRKQQQNSQSIP